MWIIPGLRMSDVTSELGELRNLAKGLGYKHVLPLMKDRIAVLPSRTHDDIGSEGSW